MSGYIYFITVEPDHYVKIGWSLNHPEARLRTLQTGCPDALRLMAFVPGSRDEERRLQITFSELAYRGEWFFNERKLLDLVEYLCDDFPRPTREGASRQTFENALWDVVIMGYEHPDMTEEARRDYRISGNGLLWRHIHPDAAEVYA